MGGSVIAVVVAAILFLEAASTCSGSQRSECMSIEADLDECIRREAPFDSAAHVELVAFRGCDKWHEIKLAEASTLCPGGTASPYDGGSLTFTGHVGIRFRNGCSCKGGEIKPGRIYGFTPTYPGYKDNKPPPLMDLVRKRSFPGHLSDDTLFFFIADAFGSGSGSGNGVGRRGGHRTGPVMVVKYPYVDVEPATANEWCAAMCNDLAQGGSIEGKRYAFPYPNGITPHAWWVRVVTGLSEREQWDDSEIAANIETNSREHCPDGYGINTIGQRQLKGCFNCATFPHSVGIPIPLLGSGVDPNTCLQGDQAGVLDSFIHDWRHQWQSFRHGVWSKDELQQSSIVSHTSTSPAQSDDDNACVQYQQQQQQQQHRVEL